MTFLNELWNKFKTDSSTTSAPSTGEDQAAEPRTPIDPQSIEAVLKAYEDVEMESLTRDDLFEKLKELSELVNKPKETELESRAEFIEKKLDAPLIHQTVRDERWQGNIQCPQCSSSNLKRLVAVAPQSAHNHRYRCLDCGTIFNDDSGTPLEQGIPPLDIWMQCWYLMGCTDSLSFIAKKLGLSLGVVERMALQLQKIFNIKSPMTRALGFEEWNKQAEGLRNQLKEDLLRQYERLDANVATQPKDTAEFRRQQHLRREISTTPAPPSPFGPKKR